MTHATPEEIHDHAYGFRPSDHVGSCGECRNAADAVASERDALKDALRQGAPEIPEDLLVRLERVQAPGRRFGVPGLSAAALLLAALTWTLFLPKTSLPPSTFSAPSTPEEDLEKLVAQLKSPSPLHQELARVALRKYGAIAVPVLERAHADPVLIDECRGFNDADRDAYRKAQTTRLTVRWQETPLYEAIDRLRQAAGINFVISNVPSPDTITVTLEMGNATVLEILDRLSQVTKLPWGRTGGLSEARIVRPGPSTYQPVFLFGSEAPDPVSLAPVRVPSDRPWIADVLRDPQAKSLDEIRRLIRDLVPGLHDGLWLLLDSSRAEIRQLAADALRRAYGSPETPPRSDLEAELDDRRVVIDSADTPLPDILLSQFSSEGMALVFDPRVPVDRRTVTFKVKNLSPKNALKLLVSQFDLTFVVCDRWVFVTTTDLAPYRRRRPQPLWATPDEAKQIEGWILDLASEDPSRRLRAKEAAQQGGRSGLNWLVHASTATEPPLSNRYAETFLSVAAELGIRLADQAPAAEDQPLTSSQKAVRARRLSLKSADKTLATLLQENGVKARFQSPVPEPILVAGGDLPVDALLRAVLLPLGLDYFMDGDTVVVATAEKARAQAERK